MSDKLMQDKVLEVLRDKKSAMRPRTVSVDVYVTPGLYTIQIGGRTVVHCAQGSAEEAKRDAQQRADKLATITGRKYVVNVY